MLPVSWESCVALPSVATASSSPLPVKRIVAAPPLKPASCWERGSWASSATVARNAALSAGTACWVTVGEKPPPSSPPPRKPSSLVASTRPASGAA